MRNGLLGTTVGLGVLLASTVAFAQSGEATTEAGGAFDGSAQLSTSTPEPEPEPVPAAPVTIAAPPEAPEAATAPRAAGGTDHEKVIGKFGVMYFGVSEQPIGAGPPGGVTRDTVQMPYVGARYWLQERLGIDVGLGLSYSSGSRTVEQGGTETTTDGAARLGIGLHGGVPLVFAYGNHYKFLAVPELNLGYATQSEAVQNPPPNTPIPPDVHRAGFRLDVGARVGTEIQFGFIGIPELALQASVGLNFRYQRWSASQDAGGPVTSASSSSESQMNLGTTVQSDPWALFSNNISAIY